MLFDQKNRTDLGRVKQSDSYYSYLDRSGRPEAQLIRKVMEEWISIYPVIEHSDFIGKLRSNDNANFLSAFFELYLYILMKKLGASDIEIEPNISSANSHPDFYIKFPSKENFYLEACCLSEAKDYLNQDSIINDIYERINNRLNGRECALSLQWEGVPLRTDFSSGKLNELVSWYNQLKESEINNRTEMNFEFDDWNIKFSTEGKINNNKGVILAILPGDVRQVTTDDRLTSALRYKGRKYGRLTEKFIIAVNIVDGTYDHQIENALFGNEAVEFNSRTGEHQEIRIGNGFWRGESKWFYTRVSAVVIAQKITPWNIFDTNPNVKVFHHPFAEIPLTNSALDILPSHKFDEEGRYKLFPGESAHNVLKLPMSWI